MAKYNTKIISCHSKDIVSIHSEQCSVTPISVIQHDKNNTCKKSLNIQSMCLKSLYTKPNYDMYLLY